MVIEKNVPLQPLNTFGIVAKAQRLVRIGSEADISALLLDPGVQSGHFFVLGGGSNVVITGDVKPLVLKIEIMGKRLVQETPKAWILEVGAGENWHDCVRWALENGFPGLENMALIPGTVGASPVQNIGAYGVELQDRFDSLDAIDVTTGASVMLNAAQCAFGYRDSIFKHKGSGGLAGKMVITRVRFALPKPWRAVLGYADLQKKIQQNPQGQHDPWQIFQWVCDIRRAKLPDPTVLGNVGSFFKNPTVSSAQCADILEREPNIVHYALPNGAFKLAAGWLIDACGWKGKSMGHAAVYAKQALVLVNQGGKDQPATGGQVMTLAKAIQTSVQQRFGVLLEIEPVVL